MPGLGLGLSRRRGVAVATGTLGVQVLDADSEDVDLPTVSVAVGGSSQATNGGSLTWTVPVGTAAATVTDPSAATYTWGASDGGSGTGKAATCAVPASPSQTIQFHRTPPYSPALDFGDARNSMYVGSVV